MQKVASDTKTREAEGIWYEPVCISSSDSGAGNTVGWLSRAHRSGVEGMEIAQPVPIIG
jgi:hypothetical protein